LDFGVCLKEGRSTSAVNRSLARLYAKALGDLRIVPVRAVLDSGES
jgi:hypothetical protein